MPVIVTRPAREAETWVTGLAALGIDAIALPLIAIAPIVQPQGVLRAWADLERSAAVMFVSANAVDHFFAQAPPGAVARWQTGELPRAWATGPGTTAALARAGLPEHLTDAPAADAAQLDSEALWARVAGQVPPGGRVLVVRGAGPDGVAAGRDWLTDQLVDAGIDVSTVAAYLRTLPAWTPAQRQQAAQAATDGSVWLFSSSEAVHHLQQLLPGQDWSQARAVATHPRIAQAVRGAGFGVVCESRAGLPAVAASLQSIA